MKLRSISVVPGMALAFAASGLFSGGYPTDATEKAVQANIVAAGYGK